MFNKDRLMFNIITTFSCLILFVLFMLFLLEGMDREIRRREIVAEYNKEFERSIKDDLL